MPYPHHDPIKPAPLKTPYLPLDDKEELQATLERVEKERDAWKDKAQVLELENEELQRQLKEQSGEDRAAQAAQLQIAQAQVAEAQDAQIQAQTQAAEMRNQMLTARLQAEEAQARAQVHNSGQTSAQNQPQIQNQTTAAPVTTVIASEINVVPVTSVTITASRPWEIPRDLNQDRYQQEFVPPNAPVFTNVPPVVHYTPHLGEPVYHGPTPSEDPGLNDRMDEFQGQFAGLQKEIKALRGKDRMATGVVMKNWTAVDIPHCVHISK
ncbi:hypothetical protein KIW84_066537 [Lathyrus oleraceus]|uniref:Uncharacterized protein n=1 Tax=Pisum sativum TaxID=3888 RepID=A0A9D4WHR0_PEA|nr:hypothetical protein KIW84_066537 [Pisum sativum]